MDGHTFLSWNIPNFVSVALMAVVLFALLKFGGQFYQSRMGA